MKRSSAGGLANSNGTSEREELNLLRLNSRFGRAALCFFALEPLLRRDGKADLVLRRIVLPDGVRAKVSAYADAVTVCVAAQTEKEAFARYEVSGAKVNLENSGGLQLEAGKMMILSRVHSFGVLGQFTFSPRCVVRSRSSTGKKLVGSAGKARNVGDSKPVVFEGQSRGVHRTRPFSDLLTIVGTSSPCDSIIGVKTAPLLAPVEERQANGNGTKAGLFLCNGG